MDRQCGHFRGVLEKQKCREICAVLGFFRACYNLYVNHGIILILLSPFYRNSKTKSSTPTTCSGDARLHHFYRHYCSCLHRHFYHGQRHSFVLLCCVCLTVGGGVKGGKNGGSLIDTPAWIKGSSELFCSYF